MAMRSWMRGTATITALALGASVLGAQAPKCDIPTNNDGGLLKANLALGPGYKPGATPADKEKALAATVKALTENPGAFQNQAGRNLFLAQVMIEWLQVPGVGAVEPRGRIGYVSDPQGRIDLFAAGDSAIKAAVAVKPECGDSLKIYTQSFWGLAINRTVAFLNEGNADSTEAWARRTAPLNPTNHIAYQVLAQLAQQKDDTAAMIEWFTKTAEVGLASSDTSAKPVAESMLLNLGALYQNASIGAEGAKAAELRAKAAETYKRYLSIKPTDFSTKLRVMRLEGAKIDSAAAQRLVAEVRTAGSALDDQQLVDVGNALSGEGNEQFAAALQVFELALARNPSNRDALYNSAVALNNLGRFEQVPPLVAKLRTIDPNNPGVFSMAQNVVRAQRLAIQTKANKGVRPRPGQSVTLTPAQNAQMKALQDTLLAYGKRIEEMSPVVQVTQFSPLPDGARFGAFVQVPPMKTAGAFTLTVEFLDAKEAVVATGSATSKAIEPGSGESVTVDAKGAGIVAFRYKVTK